MPPRRARVLLPGAAVLLWAVLASGAEPADGGAIAPASVGGDPPEASAALDADTADADSGAAAPAASTSPRETALLAWFEQAQLPGYRRLEAGDAPFMVRQMPPARGPARRALLVVPSPGTVIGAVPGFAALAEEFTARDWTVVAVQLPLLARAATAADYAALEATARARLEAACASLAGEGIEEMVMLGLEDGAALSARALIAGLGGGRVRGLAARGRWREQGGLPALPLLDLVPGQDREAAELAAQRRRTAHAPGGGPYRAIDYPGARRDFSGFEPSLARDLRGWAERAALSPG